MDQLCYVKLKHHLKNMDLEKQLIEVIDQRIRTLPNYVELRLNPELILLCCNLIENAVIDKKIKLDKKALCLRILSTIFSYNEADKKHVDSTIEFLHSNKRIKKVSFAKKCALILYDWVCRKFL